MARVQQSSNDGQTDFGAMLTGVNRNLDSNTSNYLRRSAYTGGLDFRKRLLDKKYEVTANLSGSSIYGSTTAIANTQLDGVHRYQRPDDNVQFDPTRTSLTGDAERLTVSKFGGGITRFQSVLQRYSPGFESNDLGFQSRADEAMFRNWFSLQFNEPSKLFTRAFLNFNSMQKWTTEGLPRTIGLNFNWHLQFKNWMWGHVGGNVIDQRKRFLLIERNALLRCPLDVIACQIRVGLPHLFGNRLELRIDNFVPISRQDGDHGHRGIIGTKRSRRQTQSDHKNENPTKH